MATKLDMSLDALIKTAKKKPTQEKKQQKPGLKPKTGIKGKLASKAVAAGAKQQQQQKQGQQQQKKKPGLGVAVGKKKGGGIVKGGKAGGRPQQQQPQQQQRRPGGPVSGGPTRRSGGGGGMPAPPPGYVYVPVQSLPSLQGGSRGGGGGGGNGQWRNDLYDGSPYVPASTSSKLLVNNLATNVSDDDVRELFGTVGAIREAYVHFGPDRSHKGSATVVFERRSDALAALSRYNNVALDGRKMAIEVVEAAVPRGTFKTLASGINVSRPSQGGPPRSGGGGGGSGGGRGGRGRGYGGGGGGGRDSMQE